MPESIDVDPASVAGSAQQTMQDTVQGSAPSAVPVGGMSALLDTAATGFTGLLGSRAMAASAALMPLGPAHLGTTDTGLGELISTEAANAAQTASVQSPAL